MESRSRRGSSLIKKTCSVLFSVVALAFASINNAHADLVKYRYTNTSGKVIETSPGVGFINPASGVYFMLSGGIDRKLKLTITSKNSSAPIFSQESTKVLGANDVIRFDGKDYYAQEFLSPKLKEGEYVIKSEILSSNGALVKSDSLDIVVDTTPPAAGDFSPQDYVWGNPVLSGEVWKLGLAAIDAITYSSFVISGFSDAHGVEKVAARVYKGNGDLYKEYNVLFSKAENKTSIEYRTGFFPNSDLDEVFGLEFVITDAAGNTSTTRRQKVMFDDQANVPAEPFGVYDPDVKTTLAPGLQGFAPYVAGGYVKTNPIKLAWRIPKSNWHTYRLGGIYFENSLGENKVVGEDSSFVYLVGSLPYRAEDPNYVRFYNFGEWGNSGTIRYDLFWRL